MTGIDRANGHKPASISPLYHPALADAPRPDPAELAYDLNEALSAVVPLQARAPDDAFSASYLGTEREGNAVLISEDGLLLTIGYLINECDLITVGTRIGGVAQAHIVAYDYETGFGLIRTYEDLGVKPLELGHSAAVREGDNLTVGAHGGAAQALAAKVSSVREFAGYWEYLISGAIFTEPPHPIWSGAALLDVHGKLVGIGSLFVQDAEEENIDKQPGNMFVPVDLLRPIFEILIEKGKPEHPPRPWLGIYTVEAMGHLLITSVSEQGPAVDAGVEPGDVLLSVNGQEVKTLAGLYREIWGSGEAGVPIDLAVLRDRKMIELSIITVDRGKIMRRSARH
ncbi:MAG: putative serine protease HhoB [Alphaproteobacteria bacterium MarineAlpha11_Bin1]|nr:MAG: putative serine protease HhoB [Alphaproteobacteria bacterium MarineAlpha11_Bin1]|tara:strand:+ start:24145 stop:25167 length:1023 start_codon:yes stop_codon:yes gene_type:complete